MVTYIFHHSLIVVVGMKLAINIDNNLLMFPCPAHVGKLSMGTFCIK